MDESRTIPSYNISNKCLLTCAAMIEASFLLIHLARDPAEQVVLMLISYLISGAAFGWLIWRLLKTGDSPSGRMAMLIIVVSGIVFRLTLLPIAPAASQDVQRYLWEGLVQLDGFNPYSLPPIAEQLRDLAEQHSDIHNLINHPEVPAIYPPTAQLLFRLNAAVFGGSLLGWKLILMGFDGLLVISLAMLLKQRRYPGVYLAGVLWCPLLLLETYEGGHLDIIGAALLTMGLITFLRGRWILTGGLLGLCINVKYLWPLLVLFLLAGRLVRLKPLPDTTDPGIQLPDIARGATMIAVGLLVAGLCWLPYRSELGDAFTTVRLFAEHWTFNDAIFELLRFIPGPRWIPMACIIFMLAILAIWLNIHARSDIWGDCWLLTGTALLLGPVAYPWYFLWIVPALVIRPPTWMIIWVLSVPLLHIVDWRYISTGQWDPMYWLWIIVGLTPAILLFQAWRKRAIGE